MMMATVSADNGFPSRKGAVLHVCRWLVLITLLVAEVIGLTIRFDSGTSGSGFLGSVVGLSSLLLRMLIAAVAVVLLFGAQFRSQLLQQIGQSYPSHRPWAFLLAHLAAFVIFAGLTAVVLEGGVKPWLPALAWAIVWAGMGLATLAFWIAIELPPDRWLPLVKGGPGMLLAGAAGGLAAWGAGQLSRELFWNPLGSLTLGTVHFLLCLVFRDTVLQPKNSVVGTSTFSIEIAPVCSGFEGIGLILVLVGCFLWISRRDLRFPQALLLLPLGCAVIWMLNAVRLTALIALGTFGFKDVALGGFHSQAGWLTFTAVSLGLIAGSRRWSSVAAKGILCQSDGIPRPSAAYLAPLLAIVATAMITQAFTAGFDRFYPVRVVAGGSVLWIYRRHYSELRWTFSWQAALLGISAFLLCMALAWVEPAAIHGTRVSLQEPCRLTGIWFGIWLVFRVIGSVVTVPLAEELAFRAYLSRRLITADFESLPIGAFSWSSFLVSSALFGLLHSHWIAGTLSGMIYALALYRRRRLVDAVVAHAITNALIAVTVLTTGNWSLWF
jgi:exosortase E/protease (VPEID-CTERM system)